MIKGLDKSACTKIGGAEVKLFFKLLKSLATPTLPLNGTFFSVSLVSGITIIILDKFVIQIYKLQESLNISYRDWRLPI